MQIGYCIRLLRKYQDTRMSLTDACVVRMSEIHEKHSVLTLDPDFTVYRKHGAGARGAPLAFIYPAAISD